MHTSSSPNFSKENQKHKVYKLIFLPKKVYIIKMLIDINVKQYLRR